MLEKSRGGYAMPIKKRSVASRTATVHGDGIQDVYGRCKIESLVSQCRDSSGKVGASKSNTGGKALSRHCRKTKASRVDFLSRLKTGSSRCSEPCQQEDLCMMALGSIDGRLNDHAIQKPKARISRFIITVQFSSQASAPILCFSFVSVFRALCPCQILMPFFSACSWQ